MGLVASIRKFYTIDEASIIIFLEQRDSAFEAFCNENGVSLHFFDSIDEWLLPLVYENPRFADCSQHFYHPDFKPVPGLDHHVDRETGFHKIRHLHLMNVKAYCTGYCLCVCEYEQVVYLDSDTFLLSRVDALWESHAEDNTVIAFGNERETLPNLEALFGVQLPASATDEDYGFNDGIVFYKNGPGVRELALEFMFYSDSCYHWMYAGTSGSQGILRALAAKYSTLALIQLAVEDNINWNPTDRRGDSLTFNQEHQEWTNDSNGKKQYLWRGEGNPVWNGRNQSSSVNAAWQWIGGTYRLDWRDIRGALTPHNCEYVANRAAEFFSAEPGRHLNVLEIGTCFGRTSIAFCLSLQEKGFDVHVDTCDIYASSPDYPDDYTTIDKVQENIALFGLERYVTLHHVGGNENLLARFGAKRFDFVYIDGSHEYKQVAADIVIALQLVNQKAIIIGDDFNLRDVRDAVFSIFRHNCVSVEHQQWSVAINSKRTHDLISLLPERRQNRQAIYPANLLPGKLEYSNNLVEVVADLIASRVSQKDSLESQIPGA